MWTEREEQERYRPRKLETPPKCPDCGNPTSNVDTKWDGQKVALPCNDCIAIDIGECRYCGGELDREVDFGETPFCSECVAENRGGD